MSRKWKTNRNIHVLFLKLRLTFTNNCNYIVLFCRFPLSNTQQKYYLDVVKVSIWIFFQVKFSSSVPCEKVAQLFFMYTQNKKIGLFFGELLIFKSWIYNVVVRLHLKIKKKLLLKKRGIEEENKGSFYRS